MTSQTSEPPSIPEQLLNEAIKGRWKKYRSELKRCRAEFSNEAVHDVRIALRRLISLIQILDSIAPRLRKLKRALKSQLDDFDDLRDIQVQLEEISETIEEFPQLQELQEQLKTDEKKLLKKLRKHIRKFKLKKVKRRIRKTRKSLKEGIKANLTSPILRSVDEAFLEAKERLSHVDPADPASIHHVRVVFKKFRYTVEIVHPLLKDFPAENFKQMNDYQSLMGKVQDLKVIMQTLDDFSHDASSSDAKPVHHYYETQQAEIIAAYMAEKDRLKNFWRSASDQPFPWENNQ